MVKKIVTLVLIGAFISPAHATLISVAGDLSNLGVAASIIAAPSDVNDDAAFNEAQQGFNEQHSVLLTSDLAVDGGVISAGTRVDSHMIFLNSGPGNATTLLEQFNVVWSFSDIILGVMSDSMGLLETMSSGLLGAAGTIYPAAGFAARGLETNPATCSLAVDDCYSVSGNQLALTMRVTEPGDWIRVITATNVAEPATLLLMLLGVFGFVFSRRGVIYKQFF